MNIYNSYFRIVVILNDDSKFYIHILLMHCII
jgi:hypothetical protein